MLQGARRVNLKTVYLLHERYNPVSTVLNVSTGCVCMDWKAEIRNCKTHTARKLFLCCLNIPYTVLRSNRPKIASTVY